jgi:uncharacterized membrane protein
VGAGAIVGLDVKGASATALAELALVAVCYAVGPAILQRWLIDLPSLGVIAASLGLVALVYVPIAVFSFPTQVPLASVVASIVGLAVVCTALAFVLFFQLIAEAGPVRATVITYVNPAVAAVLGVTVLSERFTAGMGIGFGLVPVGSVLATDAKAPPVAEPVAASELETAYAAEIDGCSADQRRAPMSAAPATMRSAASVVRRSIASLRPMTIVARTTAQRDPVAFSGETTLTRPWSNAATSAPYATARARPAGANAGSARGRAVRRRSRRTSAT